MIPFKNEPFVNFSVAENAQAMQDAWDKVNGELGRHYPLVIGGKKIETEQKITSINPSDKDQIVGTTGKANQELAEAAMQAALTAFESWKKETPEARARLLFKAAAIMRRRKFEFSAWLSYEAGKTRAEADADTAEAIDFMEYYGRQALELAERGKKTLISLTGEDNHLAYIPLGVGVVIPPWNFPLAIMAGMTTAALVSGNTVVLKPASTTPVIAAKFIELLEEAGMPAGVVNFLPGSGAEVGDYLVDHPKTRFISFTGSRDVGLRIFERSSRTNKGQIWMKRLVAEMGGKDSIIVHKDADLELAAVNIVNSAFGFSGQKCSACSRAIVHQDVYDEVVNRVVELTRQLTVGNVTDSGNYTGPVIDENAYNKILEYIEIGKQEGKLAAGGEKAPGNGYFIQPTVFVDLAPDARIMQEEIFGPVVGITKAKDFDHALEIANNTEYGLTGSVFAKDRAIIEKAREEFHVGNLYFNRKCTGALVGVHPFGGFNMSGTDSKAGGPDYLMLFTQQKLSSEAL